MTIEHKNPLTWPPDEPRTPAQKKRFSSQFQVSRHRTESQLEAELKRFRATNIVLSYDRGRGGSQPKDTAVALYFDLPGDRKISICCDLYAKQDDNMRALYMVIESMRTIERYGGQHLSQKSFTGFTALPAPKNVWSILGINKGAADPLSPRLRREYVMEAFRDRAREGHSKGYDMDELKQARDEALKELGVTDAA